MTPKRQTALKYTLLTAAAGFIIACWLALVGACGPSAPPEQTATSTDETLHTPTPTPTPTWQAELSPLVNAVMVKHAAITTEAAGAVSGQSALARPRTINVNIYTIDEPGNDVERFLTDNGVSVRDKWVCGEVCLRFNAVVPVALLQSLSVHPWVDSIDSIEKYYEQLSEHLNLTIAQYDAGLITEQEALARVIAPRRNGRVMMVVYVDTQSNTKSVISYLQDNNVYISTEHTQYSDTDAVFVALVPLPLILPLSQQSGIIFVGPHFLGYDNDNPEPHIEEYLDMLSPPSSSQVSGAATSGRIRTPTPTPVPLPTVVSLAIAAHGADNWQRAGINGANDSDKRIKIGVIDVGFNGYLNLAAKAEVPPRTGNNAVNSGAGP